MFRVEIEVFWKIFFGKTSLKNGSWIQNDNFIGAKGSDFSPKKSNISLMDPKGYRIQYFLK